MAEQILFSRLYWRDLKVFNYENCSPMLSSALRNYIFRATQAGLNMPGEKEVTVFYRRNCHFDIHIWALLFY